MTREESEPSVGVFYFLTGKVYVRSRPLSCLIDQDSGPRDGMVSFSTHFSFWSHLRKEDVEWTTKDDSFYPRGRVLFDQSKDIYLIRMDQCVPNWALPTILQTFHLSNLPPTKLHITHGRDPQSGDHHYQCFQCGPLTRRRVL